MRRKFLSTVVVAAVLLVSGCGPDIRPVTHFDATSKDGLVVMGIRANTWPKWQYVVMWWPIDPKTESFDTSAPPVAAGYDLFDLSDRTKKTHLIFKVRPGRHALERFLIHAGSNSSYTVYHRPNTVAFSVGAGEVVYIGDYLVVLPDPESIFPSMVGTKFRYEGRDDESARKAVSKIAGVGGDMKFVKPQSFRLK